MPFLCVQSKQISLSNITEYHLYIYDLKSLKKHDKINLLYYNDNRNYLEKGQCEKMNYRRKITLGFMLLACILFWKIPVYATGFFSATAECQRGQTVRIYTTILGDESTVSGYDYYRFNATTNTYDFIGSLDFEENGYYFNQDEEFYYNYWDNYYDDPDAPKYRHFFDDLTPQAINTTSVYRICSYQYDMNDSKVYTQTTDVSVMIQGDAPIIIYGKRSGKLNSKLQWTQDIYADGYYIYYVKNYDTKSNRISVDISNSTQYTLAKQITSNATTSFTFKKLMNGVTYTYRICSYKLVNGVPQVSSIMSEPMSITMDYYSYDGESYEQRVKRAFGSEKKKKKNYKNASKAAKQMKTIKIKVWDFKNGKKGKKITKTKWLTVNKRMAPSIKAMFDEIYKAKEKQVIKDIGSYSYRTGQHMYGLAIDINPNENYMIDGKTIMSGSFWNPKKSKYSIPLDCETVRIMERYGFYRGFWGDRKDYMHFSYFGT